MGVRAEVVGWEAMEEVEELEEPEAPRARLTAPGSIHLTVFRVVKEATAAADPRAMVARPAIVGVLVPMT